MSAAPGSDVGIAGAEISVVNAPTTNAGKDGVPSEGVQMPQESTTQGKDDASEQAEGGVAASSTEIEDGGSATQTIASESAEHEVAAADSSAQSSQPSATTTAATSGSSASPATAASVVPLTKKFNSLSVAKQFLQKASPTLSSAAATPLSGSGGSKSSGAGMVQGGSQAAAGGGGSRLSSMMPASRLMAAKLSGSTKPSSPGWAHMAPTSAASPGGTETFSSPTAPSAASGAGNGAAGSSASPKLVTALARSTSPHVRSGEANKGSPGLRNAALAGAARASSPSTGAAGAGTATGTGAAGRVPWASVKSDTTAPVAPHRSLGRPSDFPTAAEAAHAKAEAERKEKAAAAEVAAKAEQTLQNLERFRGTSLGAGKQWDDMDDDDLGEVLQFGDGTQYTVPVAAKAPKITEPVTKEERFKDVGHDRSWPQRAGESGRAAARPLAGKADAPPVATAPRAQPPIVKPAKAETLALRSGEGVSLDPSASADRGHSAFYGQSREQREPYLGRRGDSHRDDAGHGHGHSASHGHSAAHAPPPAATPARAWGPLAQRQASLNPNAVKSPPTEPPAVAAKVLSPTKPSPPVASAKAEPPSAPSSVASPPSSTGSRARQPAVLAPTASAPTPSQANGARSGMPPPSSDGRALPPHLAAAAARQQGTPYAGAKARGEPADWQNAAPAPMQSVEEEEAPVNEDKPVGRPYGSLVLSTRQRSDTSEQQNAAPAIEQPAPQVTSIHQREEMLSAAERARRRRQAEEDEREKQRERALAKAAAIEAKMREAEEEHERKKKVEQEEREKERQRQREQEQKRKDEQRQQQEATRKARLEEKNAAAAAAAPAASPAGKALPKGPMQLPASSAAQQHPSVLPPSLLSPSDEAISWRRAPALPLAAAAPGSASRRQTSAGDAEPANVSAGDKADGPQRVLLRRPSAGGKDAPASLAAAPAAPATAAKAAAADGNQKRTEKHLPGVPTGPRATREQRQSAQQEATRRGAEQGNARAPRVEIIAPTDEGAAKHQRAQQQREREARQTKAAAGPNASASPVGVLKQPTVTPAAPGRPKVSAVPEPQTTRTEVPFDGAPVWNRFQVRVGQRGKPRARFSRDEIRAQAVRVARSMDERSAPAPTNILSWEPPIANLSTRTLSRDDQFFAKKYRKGIVIAQVQIPTRTVEELAEDHRKAAVERKARLQTQSSAEIMSRQPASAAPQVKLPGGGGGGGQRQHDARVPSQQQRKRATASDTPAGGLPNGNVTPTSHLDGAQQVDATSHGPNYDVDTDADSKKPVVSLAPRAAASQSPSSTLPSPRNLSSSSTWGQGSLTFGLDPSLSPSGPANGAETERNRIKDVWGSLPSHSAQLPLKPTQNSLRGIADEFPTAMSLSMHDLRSEDVVQPQRGAEAYGAAGKGSARFGALAGNGTDREVAALTNDLAAMTTTSSPAAQASPHNVGAGQSGEARGQHLMGRARSQSPSLMRHASDVGASPTTRMLSMGSQHGAGQAHTGGQQQYDQNERGGARAAFGPYAYPTTFSGNGGGGGGGGGGYGAYGGQMQQSTPYYGVDGSFGDRYGQQPQQQQQQQYQQQQQQQQSSYQDRYRGMGGDNTGGGGLAAGLHGYDPTGVGMGAGSVGFNAYQDRSSAFANSGMGMKPGGGNNGNGGSFTAAGWPLDSPSGGSGAASLGYGSSNAYYQQSYGHSAGYGRYGQPQQQGSPYQRGGGQFQQQQQQHGRTPSSGYRGYNSAYGRGGGGLRSSSGHHDSSVAQQPQPHGSTMQATAKPFFAASTATAGASSGNEKQQYSRSVSGASSNALTGEQQTSEDSSASGNAYRGAYESALW